MESVLTEHFEHGAHVLLCVDEFRKMGFLCDFSIMLDDVCIKAHKCILAATSDYFKALLKGSLKESGESMVHLDSLPVDAVQAVIDFMYSGKLHITPENVTDILHVSSHLQVLGAIKMACKYLNKQITVNNSKEILNLAELYTLTEVFEHYDNLILNKFADFSKTKYFLDMDEKQLHKYISSDRLLISSEFDLFREVEKWVAFNCCTSAHILQNIRFSLMTVEDLLKVEESKYYNSVKDLVVEAKQHLDGCITFPIPEHCHVRYPEMCPLFVYLGRFGSLCISACNKENDSYLFEYPVYFCEELRATVLDNLLYLAMYCDDNSGTLSSFKRFDPRNLNLFPLAQVRRCRKGSTLTSSESFIYAIGGNLFSYVDIYDVSKDTWIEGPSMLVARKQHASVACNDLIFVIGGIQNRDEFPTKTGCCLNTKLGEWKEIGTLNYARRFHELVYIKDKIYAFGGLPHRDAALDSKMIPIEYYNPNTDQWTVLDCFTYTGTSFGHYVVLDGLLVGFGKEHALAKENDLWEFQNDSSTWKYRSSISLTHIQAGIVLVIKMNFKDKRISAKKC